MSNIKISEFPYENKSGFTAGDLLLLVNYQLPSGTTVNTTITDLKEYILSGITDFIPVTYSELKTLYDTSSLTTTHYIITDYQTIYDQPDFDSTGSPKYPVNTLTGDIEPLAVLATSESTLSNKVYSLLYPEDTIHYDINFSETEYMNVPAKGRITLRIDDLNNQTNYDHRTVLFKRYETSVGSGIYTEVNDSGNPSVDLPTFDIGCYNIKINNLYNPAGYDFPLTFILTNNIFGIGCRDINTGNNFYNNTIGSGGFSFNFGDECHNNVIGNNSSNNEVGDNFSENKIGDDFSGWFIQNNFTNQIVPSGSQNFTVIETLNDGFVISEDGKLKNTSLITYENVVTTSTTSFITGPTIKINANLVVTGETQLDGLLANTISATTYQNLPIDPDTYVTGFTYSNNTFVIKQNNGQPDLLQTINSVTGWTVNGNLNVTAETVLNDVTASTVNNVKYIDFDITQTGTTSSPGRLFWDYKNRTLGLGMIGGPTLQIGQEQYFLVENQTSDTLNDGTVVRAVGVNGPDGKIAIDYMIANGTIPAFTTIGVLTQPLLSGETGYVTSFGLVRNIDTTGSLYGEVWNNGDTLYVSPTNLGGFTKVRPIVPNQDIIIALVMEASSNGSIFVRPDVYRPFKDPQLITVAKQNADFTSIKDAVDSITGSSSSVRYVITVGPGEFTEGEIDLTSKPYVSIVGSSIQTTLVVPSSTNQHIFKIGQTNELSFLSLSGAGTNYAGIYCYDVGSFAQGHKMSIYDCDTGIWVESNSQDTIFYGEYIDINGVFTYGVKTLGNNGYQALANMENLYVFPSLSGLTGSYATGTGATINITSSLFEGTGLSGQTAMLSRDGGKFNVSSTDITNWGYGYRALNVGNPSVFEIDGVTFADNDWDINVEQSTARGIFLGIAQHQKITTISPEVYWNFLDSDDGELDITRKGSVTFVDGSHTDFTTLLFDGASMGLLDGGTLTIVSGTTVQADGGFGYVTKSDNSGIVRRIDWSNSQITLSANTNNYIFINENGNLGTSGSRPSSIYNIILGRVVTNSSSVEFIDLTPFNADHTSNRYASLFREALGPIYAFGSIVTEGLTPFTLNVSSGEYYFSSNEIKPLGGNGITFDQYYRNGTGSTWVISATTTVNNTQYDNNGTLTGLTAGYYTKHTLYVVGGNSYEKYFLVLGQNEYATLIQAENALLPTPPTYFTDSVAQIANIYIQQGTTGITQVEDIRPVIGFRAGGVNASSVHGNLLGLNADDHIQYLLVDGSRPMSGNLNMGNNNIVSAGTVNGVTVESHSIRHKFGGSDPVGTVTPSPNAIPYADVNGTLDSWVSTASTITFGKVKTSSSSTTVISDNDGRFLNSFTGGTYSGGTLSLTNNSGETYNITGFYTGATDVFVTGGTYSNGTATFTNNTGGTFDISGFYTGATDVFVTGATYSNNTFTYRNNTGGTFSVLFNTVTGLTSTGTIQSSIISATTYQNLPLDVFVTGATYSNNTFTYRNNTGGTFSVLFNTVTGLTSTGTIQSSVISATTYQNLPVDIRVTGGTYSNGTATFTNNTGGTFNVSGFYTGATDVFVTGATYSNNTFTYRNNTGGTFSVLFNTVTGLTSTGTIQSSVISATTYQNLPTDIRVTGGTYSNGTATFTNNTGGTFNVTGFYTGATDVFVTGGTFNKGTSTLTLTNNTGGTFNVTGITDINITGGTFNDATDTLTFTNNTGGTFNVTGITDYYVTGGTYTFGTGVLTLKRNGLSDLTITGFTSTSIVTFTGGTVDIKAAQPITAVGTASAGIISTFSPIYVFANQGNGTSTTYWNFVVPANFVSSGVLKIVTRRNYNSAVSTAVVNLYVDGVLSNISSSNIFPTSINTWETFTVNLTTPITAGQTITVTTVTTFGANGQTFYFKDLYFNYN